jgi:exosortase/archaeosortase family protein
MKRGVNSLAAYRQAILFSVKFILLFLLFYLGSFALIGVTAPGGYYIPFVAKYLDYISWLKFSLIKGASVVAALFGYTTVEEPGFILRVKDGLEIFIARDCVGFGVMSFWAAFILATTMHSLKQKIFWLFTGLILLWLINVLRIGLFLVARNRAWDMPLSLDHHTWFTIFAYGAIFLMIYFFEKRMKNEQIR